VLAAQHREQRVHSQLRAVVRSTPMTSGNDASTWSNNVPANSPAVRGSSDAAGAR